MWLVIRLHFAVIGARNIASVFSCNLCKCVERRTDQVFLPRCFFSMLSEQRREVSVAFGPGSWIQWRKLDFGGLVSFAGVRGVVIRSVHFSVKLDVSGLRIWSLMKSRFCFFKMVSWPTE
jgi:hypothetical protein